jgi:GAF domain-containing protein
LNLLSILGIFYIELMGRLPHPAPIPAMPADLVVVVFALSVEALLLRFAGRSIAAGFQRARRNERALTDSNRELEASQNALETRTRDLERRSALLRAAAEVGHVSATIYELDELLSQVARLISQQFGFYHVGIFLLDESGKTVALRAASSEGGQQMLAQGYRLEVGQPGIVEYVAGSKEPRIALDVDQEASHFKNLLLPQTRSEMALPLVTSDQLVGVLDIQSDQASAFTQEYVTVLRLVADEVAVAIRNARLLQQVQESLEAERRAYNQISREAWTQLLRTRSKQGYRCDSQGVVHQIADQPRWEDAPAPAESQTVRAAGSTVTVSVKIRDQAVGAVRLRKPGGAGEWTAEELALVETLTEQLGVALESARLYQDTQHRAARERILREISDQMQQAADMETLMRIATEELNRALGASRAYVRLDTGLSLRPAEQAGQMAREND